MDSEVTIITQPNVSVRLTSTVSAFESNKRFNRGITIAELKVRLIHLIIYKLQIS